MKRKASKIFIIEGIKLLMEQNYNVSSTSIDLQAHVDSTLSMPENWAKIKPKVLLLCEKPNKVMWND